MHPDEEDLIHLREAVARRFAREMRVYRIEARYEEEMNL